MNSLSPDFKVPSPGEPAPLSSIEFQLVAIGRKLLAAMIVFAVGVAGWTGFRIYSGIQNPSWNVDRKNVIQKIEQAKKIKNSISQSKTISKKIGETQRLANFLKAVILTSSSSTSIETLQVDNATTFHNCIIVTVCPESTPSDDTAKFISTISANIGQAGYNIAFQQIDTRLVVSPTGSPVRKVTFKTPLSFNPQP